MEAKLNDYHKMTNAIKMESVVSWSKLKLSVCNRLNTQNKHSNLFNC